MTSSSIVLSTADLREVARYASACAEQVLGLFEEAHPTDRRPREALDAAWTFARGGRRGKVLRDTAAAALEAGREADTTAAGAAARAAMCAASAPYLHPLARAHQVKHLLGAGAYAAHAAELAAGGDRGVAAARLDDAGRRATPELVEVLRRYPTAPPGGGRVGALLRDLDTALRSRP